MIPFTNNYNFMKKIYQNLITAKVKKVKRFWKPVIFYFFGDGKARKSNLVQKLFCSEFYLKKKMQKSGSTWWNRWDNIVTYLNDTPAEVEVK
ncbi:4938_t:CDS:2, partial [Scutellospora calospora]